MIRSRIVHFKTDLMRLDLLNLDVDILNRLYKAKEKELEVAILSGALWDEVSNKRKALTELSSLLHLKLLRQRSDSGRFPTRPEEID